MTEIQQRETLQSFLEQETNAERMQNLFAIAVEQNKSPSHDLHHIILTLHYARQLYQWCLNNYPESPQWEQIFAAVCVHDLGRNDPTLHGLDSISKSLAEAQPVLTQVGYTPDEVEAICNIIAQQDQPENVPTRIEASILKEADFLAGLGAWGILRIILWAGESGRTVPEILEAFELRMPARLASLQLQPSREIAWKEWQITQLYLAYLKEQYCGQETESYPGKYIIIEGTSGSGKDTQAELLAEWLQKQGQEVVIIHEPSETLRATLGLWKEAYGEVSAQARKHIFTADRIMIMREVIENLRAGKIVLGIRSCLTTIAYQGINQFEMAEIAYLHRFVPKPDFVIVLDVKPPTALARIDSALVTQERRKRGDHEDLEQLELHLQRLKKIVQDFLPPLLPTAIIDGNPPLEIVHDRIIQKITALKLLGEVKQCDP